MRRLALLLLVLSGCATAAGRRQVVSVDSSPRGLTVRDPDDPAKPLGVTPFFADLDRSSAHTWQVSAKNGPVATQSVECKYRWGASALANAPCLLLSSANLAAGLFVYGAADGVDLVTGASWECPDQVIVKADPPAAIKTDADAAVAALDQEIEARKCPTVLVAPPQASDPAISELIAARFKLAYQHDVHCARFVEYRTGEDLFLRAGITHDAGLDPKTFERSRLNAIALATGATNLAVLGVKSVEKKLTVSPALYDVHRLEPVPAASFEIDLARERSAPQGDWMELAGRWISFVPNAIAFSAAVKDFSYEPVAGGKVFEKRFPDSVLPSILGNWTILYMSPPGAYANWQITAGLSPQILFGFNSAVLRVEGVGGTQRSLEVDVVHLATMYGPNATLHTPFGAFGVWLALGLGMNLNWEAGGPWDTDFDAGLYGTFGLSYTAWVSDNVFAQFGVQTFLSRSPHVVRNEYQLQQFAQAAFTVGYYLPELRKMVRDRF